MTGLTIEHFRMSRLTATLSLLSALTMATLINTIMKISENFARIVEKLNPNFSSPSIKVRAGFF